MTGSGIESDFVLPDSLSYRIIAHCQLSISILAQTVDFFAQLAYRRIHLRLFAPQTIPEALPLDSAKGSSTLWTPFRAIELVTTAYSVRVFIRPHYPNRKIPKKRGITPYALCHSASCPSLRQRRRRANRRHPAGIHGAYRRQHRRYRSRRPLYGGKSAESPHFRG